MISRRISVLIAVLASVLASAGCTRGPGRTETSAQPAKLEAVPGSALHKVTLTQAAVEALDVRTEPVRTVGGHLVIPTTAVIYDPQGASWTYLVAGPRTFLRQAIGIDRFTGADAVLGSGPAAGAAVVAVGAPELLGAEYGVGEE